MNIAANTPTLVPEKDELKVKKGGAFMCGHRMEYCVTCQLDQPLEVYAFDPDILRDMANNLGLSQQEGLEMELRRFVRPNGPSPDYDPAQDPDAQFLSVCAFCRTSSISPTPPAKPLFVEWEQIDGWTALARLTNPETTPDYNRQVSQAGAMRFFKSLGRDYSMPLGGTSSPFLWLLGLVLTAGLMGIMIAIYKESRGSAGVLSVIFILAIICVGGLAALIIRGRSGKGNIASLISVPGIMNAMNGFAIEASVLEKRLESADPGGRLKRIWRIVSQIAKAERKGKLMFQEELKNEK